MRGNTDEGGFENDPEFRRRYLLEGHKCRPIALFQNDPPDEGGRCVWLGELTEPFPKAHPSDGDDAERYCLHWKTPLKEVVFALDGMPDGSAFLGIGAVLSEPAKAFREAKWNLDFLAEHARGMIHNQDGAPRFEPVELPRCAHCDRERPALDWRFGWCSTCGYNLEAPHKFPEVGDGGWVGPEGEWMETRSECANGCGERTLGHGWADHEGQREPCPAAEEAMP